ncbi:hypothetical protein RI138_28850 [Streptomyces sp. C11-1]|uniref:Uncharacterized protein n=1 Tax=Streptomyces durocortorensis TaxID=2811104 RepID=A0ABY9W3X4_9ACTN|nr:hypothetical protein [Streptomyces durocortorensis]WNF30510.1 hypothetical protein RI138_28850 [Streptomyces durocortorensis]
MKWNAGAIELGRVVVGEGNTCRLRKLAASGAGRLGLSSLV